MQALLLLAAEEAEPSKTAFYVAGIALAAWAVVLTFIGMSRPTFPSSAGVSRMVMAITVVLVVGVAAATILTS